MSRALDIRACGVLPAVRPQAAGSGRCKAFASPAGRPAPNKRDRPRGGLLRVILNLIRRHVLKSFDGDRS